MFNSTDYERRHASTLSRTAVTFLVLVLIMSCLLTLPSCSQIHYLVSKKVEITFDANGGMITGKGVETSGGDSGYTATCIVGDPLPDIKARKEYYQFVGWFTEKEGGVMVESPSEDTKVLYAQYESANLERAVKISKITTGRPGNKVRISKDESSNVLSVTFKVSPYYGQKVAFTNKKGKVIQEIEVSGNGGTSGGDEKEAGETAGEDFSPDGKLVTAEIPDRRWMDHKVTSYYIKSFGNDHVDEGKPKRFRITLDGQSKYFDLPIEGSAVWYGGSDEAPADRSGVIVATDDDSVYAKNGDTIYKWKKADVMINLADVLTTPVYDIYNAYSSKFFPIRGKAMYMDGGGKGLSRYSAVPKKKATHKNNKTGQKTFMVPVQWDFAQTIALAESRALKSGYTLYIADTFRPMDSVDPVAKAVDNASLLAYGGTSAHNFGMAVDTGWQKVNKKGEPVGKPSVKNLQELNKKAAVKGPNGNRRESWWQGVNKLPQEWWHYGDSVLPAGYRTHAKRVGSLYVNLEECPSMKRSKMEG